MWPYVTLFTYTMKMLLLHKYYPLGICSKYNIWIDHNGRDLAAVWGILSVSFLFFSFLFKSLSLSLCLCPCLSVSVFPSLFLYVCLWRVEFDVEYLPSLLSALFFWDRLSHWTRRSDSARLADQWAPGICLFVHVLSLQSYRSAAPLLHAEPEVDLQFSCLSSKHFKDGAISQALFH